MTPSALKTAGHMPETVDMVQIAMSHRSAAHPLFSILRNQLLTRAKAGALLKNYDAHACVLRRLLLRAAAIMPEEAVGYVLENVRTEFGAGKADDRHQLQLLDLAAQCGITSNEFKHFPIQSGVKLFIKTVCRYYDPTKQTLANARGLYRPAIAAGAITATEILAIEEFKALQKAFSCFRLDKHIWFDHVTVEAQHKDESLALAHFFMGQGRHTEALLFGLNGVLDATEKLYDGLVSAIQETDS